MPSDQARFGRRPAALTSDATWLEPFPWYRRMRNETPVRYDDEREVWDVFRYEDVKRVLQDHDAFSSEFQRVIADADGSTDDSAGEELPNQASSTPTPDAEHPPPEQPQIGKTMITTDPPEHERFRSIVAAPFRPRQIREFRPRIQAIATDLLDGVDGRVDLIETFAHPLPVLVILEVLGIPKGDHEQVSEWSRTVIASPDGDASDAERRRMAERRNQTQREMDEYFRDLLADRRQHPQDDLLTTIAHAGEGSLTEEEMVSTSMLLLIAGNVTTINWIANAVWTFEETTLFDDLRTGDVDLNQALTEVLRYRSPVQSFFRVANRDIELRDKQISDGDLVTAWIGSANRDGHHFDDPDSFSPRRRPNDHLSFGHGIHYCLGAPLARLEAEVALSTLLREFERIDADTTEVAPVQSPIIYGLQQLPVEIQ